MLTTLEAQIKRSCGRVDAGADKALTYLAQYGLHILVITCLLAGLVLLVWAHWEM
jgi:hypothetical protein